MRFTSSALVALLAMSQSAAAASCNVLVDRDSGILFNWDIWADNVYGIPGWCGGFWDNLKNRGCDPSRTYCGGLESSRIMNIRFTTLLTCTKDQIHRAWYEATKNEFGSISCQG